MYPLLLVALGVVVLLFGRRLGVLGAAVGAMLGVMFLRWASFESNLVWNLLIVGGLAALGFIFGRFATRYEEVICMVFGALGGALIVAASLDLFRVDTVGITGLLALIGGVIGLVLARRFRWWTMVVISGLLGGMLVVRGLIQWMPGLDGTIGSLLILAMAGGSGWYQSRGVRERREERKADSAPAPAAAAPSAAAPAAASPAGPSAAPSAPPPAPPAAPPSAPSASQAPPPPAS